MKALIAICIAIGAAIAGSLSALARLGKIWQIGPHLPSDVTDIVANIPLVPAMDTNMASKSPKTTQTMNTTTPLPTAPPEPVSAQPAHKNMLDVFCRAIATMEGGPNDASTRNNNPGNFRKSPVGYASMYGNVRCSPAGFAIFPTYALGWLYLENTVHHRAIVHPNWTIYDFFANYAPASDGNQPKHYAEVVAGACNVSPQVTLAKLFA